MGSRPAPRIVAQSRSSVMIRQLRLQSISSSTSSALIRSMAEHSKKAGASSAIRRAMDRVEQPANFVRTSPQRSGTKKRHRKISLHTKEGLIMRAGTFVADMKEIRRRARQHLAEGAITKNYKGSVEEGITILNHAVATEIICVLRYKFHAVCATGLASEAVKEEFAQHAKEEEQHLDLLCERINQLGGKPNLNPEGVAARAASEYVEGENLVDMIKENLIAERIAIETYRDMVRHFGDSDPTTRVLL